MRYNNSLTLSIVFSLASFLPLQTQTTMLLDTQVLEKSSFLLHQQNKKTQKIYHYIITLVENNKQNIRIISRYNSEDDSKIISLLQKLDNNHWKKIQQIEYDKHPDYFPNPEQNYPQRIINYGKKKYIPPYIFAD